MTTAAPSTALATIQPAFTDSERLALAGFLAGYRGLTREAYTLDLRQFTTWCRARSLHLFAVRRGDIEGFARDLEALGRARATVTRRLCTIAGFYRYAVEEELLEHSPAALVRRPRVDYESRAVALDRNELGALLVAAGLGPPAEHALISLLALNGLRVSEATGVDIEHLGLDRGHRTLTITRKGGKVVTIPLAPRTAGRSTWRPANAPTGPSSWPPTAGGWTATAPGGSSARSRAAPGSASPSPRTRSGTRSSPRRWTPGFRCATSKKPPHMLTRERRCGRARGSLDRHATYIVAAYIAGAAR
jgi:integrase/recombinase XerD